MQTLFFILFYVYLSLFYSHLHYYTLTLASLSSNKILESRILTLDQVWDF